MVKRKAHDGWVEGSELKDVGVSTRGTCQYWVGYKPGYQVGLDPVVVQATRPLLGQGINPVIRRREVML